MPNLTKNGQTITVRDSQVGIYRKHGWIDESVTPSMNHTKDELVDFAVAAGWDHDDAEAATKQQLVDSIT